MAAHILVLRLAQLLGGLRGATRAARRRRIGVFLAVAAPALAILTVTAIPRDDIRGLFVLTVAAASLAMVAMVIVPLLARTRDPLDPRFFATFDASPWQLAPTLMVAGLFSVPVFTAALVGLVLGSAWLLAGAHWALVLPCLLVVLVTLSLLARLTEWIAAFAPAERRSPEFIALTIVLALTVVTPLVVFVFSLDWRDGVPDELWDAVGVLAATPLGAAAAVPGLVVMDIGSLPLSVVSAVVTPVGLFLLWVLAVRSSLDEAARSSGASGSAGLGWFGVFVGGSAGAVAARSMVYWFRDRRHLANLVVVPVAGVAVVVPLLVAGIPPSLAALAPLPIMALLLGWLPHNDIAYDSSAIWLHVVSGVNGFADRIGRLVPVLFIAVPVLTVAIAVCVAWSGDWYVFPAMVGLCTALLGTGLGASSVASVVGPYPVSRPGDGAFQRPQSTRSGGVSQSLVLIVSVVLTGPVWFWAWRSATLGIDAEYALWWGLGIGVTAFAVGVLLGGGLFERRNAELMEFAESS